MKSMFQIIAAVACAVALTACGGGDKTPAGVPVPVQPEYKLTETKVGTVGVAAASGDTVVINLVGYIYDGSKSDGKGAKAQSSIDTGLPYPAFTVGVGAKSTGWDLALIGMKAGGTRTTVLPANLAYGANGFPAQDTVKGITYPVIPANTPLVYDFEMVSVTKAVIIPSTVITDLQVGTGAEAVAGKTASVRYTGWLYDPNSATKKGAQFDSNLTAAAPFDIVVDASPLQVIFGFNKGVKGMKVGGKRSVVIPDYQAYGSTATAAIPANSTLIFEIELIAVK